MAAIVYILKISDKNLIYQGESVEKRNICLTITQIRRHLNFGNMSLQKPKQKKCKILFCYTEMAWIDLLRQLGNFNWGPG